MADYISLLINWVSLSTFVWKSDILALPLQISPYSSSEDLLATEKQNQKLFSYNIDASNVFM